MALRQGSWRGLGFVAGVGWGWNRPDSSALGNGQRSGEACPDGLRLASLTSLNGRGRMDEADLRRPIAKDRGVASGTGSEPPSSSPTLRGCPRRAAGGRHWGLQTSRMPSSSSDRAIIHALTHRGTTAGRNSTCRSSTSTSRSLPRNSRCARVLTPASRFWTCASRPRRADAHWLCDALVVVPAGRDERLPPGLRQPDDPFTLARLRPKMPATASGERPRSRISPARRPLHRCLQPPEPA